MGATGAVGKAVSEGLNARGHEVRPIARSEGVSVDDAAALKRAFAGVDGAFLMIPFDMAAPDLHRREDEIGRNLADAVETSGVRRVVFLSGTSAHLKHDAGSGWGASMMEERLDDLDIPELVHLRGCFFMENHLQGLEMIATAGIYGWAFRSDVATPMIATRDVAERAAELLTEEPFQQPRVRELLGPRDYTMEEATRILDSAIGKPGLKYAHLSYEDARQGMLDAGVSPSFADAVMATARSFNDGKPWAREQRSAENTTASTLERWAEVVFRDAYRTATGDRTRA